jgi:hypothetical protein
MASKGEFPVPPPPAPPPGSHRRINTLGKGCDRHGPTVPAYYKPVVAFTREHLLGDEHGDVHEALIASETDKPKLGDGVNIVVEPRGAVGELRVVWVGPPFYAPGTRWAETRYCLHVLKQGASTTIAVDESWSMIR